MNDFTKDNALPVVKKETLFTKIFNWFSNIFFNNRYKKNISDSINTDNTSINEIQKNNFIESIKVESKDKIFSLQRKLKANQVKISELTDKELDEMIELYKSQIQSKKIKLKNSIN